MPEFVVDKATRMLNTVKKCLNGSRILLLGMAYKADLSDFRESPAIEVYLQLQQAGAEVSFHDTWLPVITDHNPCVQGFTSDVLRNADLVIITTNHSDVDYRRVVELAPLDTRYAQCYARNRQRQSGFLMRKPKRVSREVTMHMSQHTLMRVRKSVVEPRSGTSVT